MSLDLHLTNVKYVKRLCGALSSDSRIRILLLLSERELCIEDLSRALGTSKANVSFHVKVLEEAGLVRCRYMPGVKGVKKICWLAVDEVRIVLSKKFSDNPSSAVDSGGYSS